MKGFYYDMRFYSWTYGFEAWEGKPKFCIGRAEYGGCWWYFLHIGPFWVNVSPV